jgi:hypothetical protein
MAIIYKVENISPNIYNNFTFIDGNGVNKILDLLPNVSYYINGNSVVSPALFITVLSLGKESIRYCFESCCNGDIFDFDGSDQHPFITYQVGDIIYFDQAVSSSNPNNFKTGCYKLISIGSTNSHSCSVSGSLNVSVVAFESNPYSSCTECIDIYSCCVNYFVTNQSSQDVKTSIEFTPCCNEDKKSPYFIQYQTGISICSSTGIKILKGDVQVINGGNCPDCPTTSTTTIGPVVTTTTTFAPPIPPIEPKNECDVITIFPLGVECFTIEPTNSDSYDGAITLGITGGTPPYEVIWENGSLSQSLSNLTYGEYNSIVTDYYGDFTAYTTCILSARTPVVTTTTTNNEPLPSYEDICITIIRGDKLNSFVEYYQFDFNGYIDQYPTWTDTTNNLDIIWNQTGNQWEISGWTPGQIVNTNPATPPLSGWVSLGSTLPYRILSITAVLGLCQLISTPNLTIVTNDPECGCDGSIMLTPFGGTPPYSYSINGGATYSPTTIYNNLCQGTYIVYVRDFSGFTYTQTVTLSAATSSVNYILTMSYLPGNNFGITISPSLPIGTTVTFDVIHTNTFNVGPQPSSATFNNTVTLYVNGPSVPFTPPVIGTSNIPVPQPFPCQGSLLYSTTKQTTWANLSMTFGTVIGGSYTNTISPVLPTPNCYVATKSFYIYINNASINNDCDTIRVVNPKPPKIQ